MSKHVQVHIKNMRLRPIIGCEKYERKERQDVMVSVWFKYNAAKAIDYDEISQAANYKEVYDKIYAAVQDSNFRLIESLGNMIYDIIKQNAANYDVRVQIEKPRALTFAETVMITIDDSYR